MFSVEFETLGVPGGGAWPPWGSLHALHGQTPGSQLVLILIIALVDFLPLVCSGQSLAKFFVCVVYKLAYNFDK